MKSGFDNEQNGVTNVGGEDIGKVKVDAADALGYLGNKLIAGSNITLNTSASDITISANVASVAGHQIANEGSQLPLQPTLDFVGTGVHVTDDTGNNKTIVKIEGIEVSSPITDTTLTCEAGYHYVCNGVTTANLPAGVQGMVIGFADYGDTFAGSPLTITANAGDTIVDDTATTLVLDRNTSTVMLGFCNDRWILLTAETFRDLGVSQGSVSGVSDGDKGDIIVSNNGSSWLLDTTGVTANTYGSASVIPVVTVDAKGRITSVVDTSIAIAQSAVTDLTTDLAAKAPLASPALTGTPTAPTAVTTTNTTQVATTAFVQQELAALPASATNLGYTASPTDGTVTSSTGTDATLPLVTGVNAGLMAPADFTKVGYITATGAVNLDNLGAAAFLNVGTTANLVVQLDGTGKLPAVDGSLLTNLPSGFADPMTTAGDIIIRNGGNTTARLGIGSEGQILTVTSGVPAWGAVSSSGHTIQDEGTPLTQRTNLDFVGNGVTVTDDSGNDKTIVTVPGGASAYTDLTDVDTTGLSVGQTMIWNGTFWVPGSASGGRELLTADRTYYVRTDGSDSNDGLTDSAGGAFLTPQKASDIVGPLDLNGFNVFVVFQEGTYNLTTLTLKEPVGNGKIFFGGANENINVIFDSASTEGILIGDNIKTYYFRNITLKRTANTLKEMIVLNSCSCTFDNIKLWQINTNASRGTGIYAVNSYLNFRKNLFVEGTFRNLFFGDYSTNFAMVYDYNASVANLTITYQNTPVLTRFINLSSSSVYYGNTVASFGVDYVGSVSKGDDIVTPASELTL